MDIILENEQRLNIEIYNDAFKIKIFKSFQIFSKKFYLEELIKFQLFKLYTSIENIINFIQIILLQKKYIFEENKKKIILTLISPIPNIKNIIFKIPKLAYNSEEMIELLINEIKLIKEGSLNELKIKNEDLINYIEK